MPREDVPYPGAAICSIKERVEEIADEVDEKLETINGTRGDGSGNLNIIPVGPGLAVETDLIHHEVKLRLITGDLPAAAVDNVNGQTGTVVLDASDINDPQWGNLNVHQIIQGLNANINNATQAINTEATNRQNADAALQSNINAALATIPSEAAQAVANDATVQQLSSDVTALQAADAGNVKLTGSQTVAGNKTWTGTQTFNGAANFASSLNRKSANITKGTTPASNQYTNFSVTDSAGTAIGNIGMTHYSNGNVDMAVGNNESRNGLQPNPTLRIRVDSAGAATMQGLTPGSSAGSTEIATVGYVSDTGGSLNNLMHTSANEEFSGTKTGRTGNYGGIFRTKCTDIDVTNPPATEKMTVISFSDKNDVTYANIRAGYGSNGKVTVGLTIRNNDGTIKYITLGTADN